MDCSLIGKIPTSAPEYDSQVLHEAIAIARGDSMMLPTRAHLTALYQKLMESKRLLLSLQKAFEDGGRLPARPEVQ